MNHLKNLNTPKLIAKQLDLTHLSVYYKSCWSLIDGIPTPKKKIKEKQARVFVPRKKNALQISSNRSLSLLFHYKATDGSFFDDLGQRALVVAFKVKGDNTGYLLGLISKVTVGFVGSNTSKEKGIEKWACFLIDDVSLASFVSTKKDTTN